MTDLNTLITNWQAARPVDDTEPIAGESTSPKVVAVLSCPRLAFTDTLGCIHDVFAPLGIGIVRHSGVFWGQSLTRLMEESVKRGVEFIITVDYDSIFTKDHVLELIRLIAIDENIDAVVPVQVRRESNRSMFTIIDDDGVPLDKCGWEEFNKPLTKITTGHFGLTIIRTASLARLAKPWFKAIPDLDGAWREQHIDEDIYFWLNAMAAKWNVCLANGVRIGHLQNVIAWPRADFTPQFQYVSGWLEKGQPEVVEWQS